MYQMQKLESENNKNMVVIVVLPTNNSYIYKKNKRISPSLIKYKHLE